MPLVDTSVLLPLLNPDHEQHKAAKQLFEDADRVILHPCVVAELTTVVRRLAKAEGLDGNTQARAALQALLRQPRVTLRADMDHRGAAELYMAVPGISFTDAVLAVSPAHFDRMDAVTFDDGVRKARARHGGAKGRQGSGKGPRVERRRRS